MQISHLPFASPSAQRPAVMAKFGSLDELRKKERVDRVEGVERIESLMDKPQRLMAVPSSSDFKPLSNNFKQMEHDGTSTINIQT